MGPLSAMSNQGRPRPRPSDKKPPARVRIDPSGGWTLIPPHCVFELEPDLADVEMLLKEGDFEEARDAGLFILEECQDMTAAHLLLGKIAEKHMNDLTIAQGHYGYVFELTLKWLGDLDMARMNQAEKINRISAEAAEGLKRVLEKRGQMAKASQVARHLAAWKGQPAPKNAPAAAPAKPAASTPPTVLQAAPAKPAPTPAVAPPPASAPARPVSPITPANRPGGPPRPFAGPKNRRPMAPRPNRNRPGPGKPSSES